MATEDDRPAPRSMADIVSDLRMLTHSDGSLHAISAMIYRDWVLTVDTVEARVFPMVLWSDHFPAATQLSGMLLKRFDETPPVIWDLGFLDCVTRILASPIEVIFYLQARSQHFDKVVSDSEFNFLSYHIRSKLAMPDDVDWMMLERDFATVVDDLWLSSATQQTSATP